MALSDLPMVILGYGYFLDVVAGFSEKS